MGRMGRAIRRRAVSDERRAKSRKRGWRTPVQNQAVEHIEDSASMLGILASLEKTGSHQRKGRG